MFRKFLSKRLLSIAFCVNLIVLAPVNASTHKPIKLTLHDWTGQLVTTNLMAEVLRKAGTNVELVQADYISQFAGLVTGEFHVAMEVWETTARQAMDEAIATGQVENLGATGMRAIEEWWYPMYMKEYCPGLPDWEALNDCAQAFSTPETAPKGRYIGGPVTWGGFDDERVKALGLNYEVIHASTDSELFAELKFAYQRKEPILLWMYLPHWAPDLYSGEWVEFPEYSVECYSDPTAGRNFHMAYDCGKPVGPIWKVAWSGVKEHWSDAYQIIKRFHIENEEMGKMIAAIDLEGKKLSAVVDNWMIENEDRWRLWIN